MITDRQTDRRTELWTFAILESLSRLKKHKGPPVPIIPLFTHSLCSDHSTHYSFFLFRSFHSHLSLVWIRETKQGPNPATHKVYKRYYWSWYFTYHHNLYLIRFLRIQLCLGRQQVGVGGYGWASQVKLLWCLVSHRNQFWVIWSGAQTGAETDIFDQFTF